LPSGGTVLVTDTVGFIQKLPHQLVAAFRATLEEVLEADLLLHVIDVTHPNVLEQVASVHDTLIEIGAVDKPAISALNKIDRLPGGADFPESSERLSRMLDEFSNSVPISALRGRGISALLDRVEEELQARMIPLSVTIPYRRGDLVDLFHKRGQILHETYKGEGTYIEGKLPAYVATKFSEFD
jgi:GTP-binding protein HflX